MRPRTVLPLLLVFVLGTFAGTGRATAQTSSDAEAAEEARARAEELFAYAAGGNFNALYDRIHPDAQAVIPRVVGIKVFAEVYALARPGRAEVIDVAIGEWTWPVTDQTYPDAAEVRYEQPYVDAEGRERILETEMYLARYEGEWRWFLGGDRAYVARVIGLYAPPPPAESPGDTEGLLNTVVADLDRFYRDALAATDYAYASPGVVVVEEGQGVQTGCGAAQAGFWAFYCPPDRTVYLDFPFLGDLEQRYGDFAAAFVVGHEWAHHVQTAVGIERSEAPDEVNEVYSIQLELLADCLTGVWALDADTRGLFDLVDVAEAIAFTFERLGDPEGVDEFDPQAHGTNQQRLDAFTNGYDDGFVGCEEVL